MTEYVSNPDEAKEYWGRYRYFYLAFFIVFSTFTIRLWYLQILSGTELREFSEKNRIKQNKIIAPRGLILDREGRVLVENLPGFEVVISPQYVDNLEALAKAISPILGIEADKLVQKVQKSRRQNGVFAQIKLKDNLTREEVFRLKRIRLETPGLEIRESIVRFYPMAENGAQLYGYVGEISKNQLPLLNDYYKGILKLDQGDIIGKNGLEEALEKDIRGIDGISFIQVDAHGRETITATPNVYGEQIKDQEPLHGNNAVLTIDRDIQEAAYKSMMTNQRIGALVAMKSDGEILAWLNSPSYNPNEFSTGISASTWSRLINDQFKPLRNKVIQDHYSPGSTFKPFVALAALQEKVITPTTIVAAPGVFMFARRPYHDSIRGGHGNITVYEAIEESSNVFFYKMGIALGVDKMYNYITPLGLGSPTGIDMPREVSGNIPNSEWKKRERGEEWQKGEDLSTAIGQGFINVTPMQMAVAYNTIAREGEVVRPFIVSKIIDQDGKVLKQNFPRIVRDVTEKNTSTGIKYDKETFRVVKEAMRRVANGNKGTGRYWKIPGVQMAGKSGTVQVMGFAANDIYGNCLSRPILQRHHGWYIAWAPWDKPEITVAVMAEHACHGNTGAAPIVRDVIQAYFQKHHPEIIAEGMLKSKTQAKLKPAAEPVQTQEGE
jgi:penicillin-binding protein 2